tara:strand:+ start:1647 stop:2444 length:798 start_codon:yes stop_codon:yes gene_type:complete
MTRIKVLEEKREKVYDKINEIETHLENLSAERKEKQTNVLKKYIDTFDGFTVRYFSDKVSVYVKDGNYSLLDMYLYDEWDGDNRTYKRIDFSTSSFRTEYKTGADMEWAADRFKVLAFYSKALADHMDDILAEVNVIAEKYSKLSLKLYEKKRPLNNEVREINEKIDELKDELMMWKLMSKDGLTIDPDKEDSYLPRFQVKFDWELSSVKSIRGVKKSASGKSVDLQVSVRRGYGDNSSLEVIDVDRVRFDNVRAFIRRNEDQIV